ncbi:hypothetical protein L6164_015118 [Bauhinia variegata]|uniref:Uncharacterized protein n=1 Tax=Bauhinia variegata TaxID=167791 RepID=A0ACB9NJR3_BAUVA|nr:hypothetical protein L6164_015118 [Bauhinia variegata]
MLGSLELEPFDHSSSDLYFGPPFYLRTWDLERSPRLSTLCLKHFGLSNWSSLSWERRNWDLRLAKVLGFQNVYTTSISNWCWVLTTRVLRRCVLNVEMPPSPALRCSPGRELRGDSHKRGRSLESGLLFREKDDDLALFSEMQSRERENFLLHSPDDFEDSLSTKLKDFSGIKLGISISSRGESSDLLNADGDKNDYDWLLTPPDTPLFPSLDDEPLPLNTASRGRPRSKPITISRSSTMEKSYRSNRGSASPNRLSLSPRSANNAFQSRGRPSSAPNSSPTKSVRHATPSRRQSPPPSKPSTPAPRSSTPTPRRMSTGSSGPGVSSGIRGTSPVKTSRGNSASPKMRAWQTNIPGFSSDAPPNLRTSLADRPASYVRGSSPASRNGRDSTSKFSRQSMSPTASRSSSSLSHDRDQLSSRSKGSVASSGDDDLDSIQSIPVGSLDRLGSRRVGSISNNRALPFSKKSSKMFSPNSAPKRSFDSAIRQMDRKSPQNMFRPLLSSVPSTTFYVGKTSSAQRSLVSRNSSVTTSSNASTDQGTSLAHDTEGSDHNQDDMASETEKAPYPNTHEEVFAFDKIEIVNANIGNKINDDSFDIKHNEISGDFGPFELEDSVYRGRDTEVNVSSEASHLRGDISEISGFENAAVCSRCGRHYEAINQSEEDIKLCPECSRKDSLLRVIIPETALAVVDSSSNISAEEKALPETDQPIVTSELPLDTDLGDLRLPLGEWDAAEESQTSCSDLIKDHSGQTSLPILLAEGDGHMPANQQNLDQLRVDYKKPDDDIGDQQLHHYNDRSNLKVDFLEGTGISVLLKRSSSIKGPVVQGRSFTAMNISYDDLSFARDSVHSIRSSSGRGSYSASSSVDLSSVRQMESRVQRQLSGKKLDMDHGHDIRMKSHSIGSSFSGTSIHSNHGLGLVTHETTDNTECGIIEGMPVVSQELQASEIIVTDVIDASSMGSVDDAGDKFEHHEFGRVTDDCSSQLLNQVVGVQSYENSVLSFPNHGDCISYENVDHPNNAEKSAMATGSSFAEDHDVQNSRIDGLDVVPIANSRTIAELEIERENCCQNNSGVGNDDLSLVSKSTTDDFQEPSVPNSSNDHFTTSVAESNTSDGSHGIEESTVTVECQGAGNTRSLTLEEATDTILFCSSIIHDLAYQAATIALEKESPVPLEGSEPTVTVLGKPNSGRKDYRGRSVSKRTLKSQSQSQKIRQRQRVETGIKSSPDKTENDENRDESFTRNVGIPDKVDGMKPPKLESKCNCTIM